MDKADAPRFAGLMALLAVTFQVELSGPMIAAYEIALADLPIDEIEAGVHACLRQCRFMPRPADIRQRRTGNLVDPRDRVETLDELRARGLRVREVVAQPALTSQESRP